MTAMKMKAYPGFDEYLADQSPRNQRVIRALRVFVKRVAPQLVESVKWGNGCWIKGKAPVAYLYSAPSSSLRYLNATRRLVPKKYGRDIRACAEACDARDHPCG